MPMSIHSKTENYISRHIVCILFNNRALSAGIKIKRLAETDNPVIPCK
jgi:hypothetical protein